MATDSHDVPLLQTPSTERTRALDALGWSPGARAGVEADAAEEAALLLAFNEAMGAKMSDPESTINHARRLVCRDLRNKSERCVWNFDTPDHCTALVPFSEFFCPTHVDEILSRTDLHVLDAWGRLQGAMYWARKDREAGQHAPQSPEVKPEEK